MSLQEYVCEILREGAQNYDNPAGFVKGASYFFGPRELDEPAYLTSEDRSCVLVATHLEEIPPDRWLRGVFYDRIRILVQLLSDANSSEQNAIPSFEQDAERKVWRKRFNLHLRNLVTGGLPGPGIGETMVLLGRDVVLARISEAADRLIRAAGGKEKVAWRKILPKHRQWQLDVSS